MFFSTQWRKQWIGEKMSWQTIVLLNGLHVPFIQFGDPTKLGKVIHAAGVFTNIHPENAPVVYVDMPAPFGNG